MPDGWPVYTQDVEKEARIATRFPGISIVSEDSEPYFPLIVKDSLEALSKLPTGKALLDAIVMAAPSDNRGFKVLVKRIPISYKEVQIDDKRKFKPSGGRSYASPAQSRIGVSSTAASNGQGASVIVGWCPNQVYVADHGRGGKKGYVPACLTLGHELIHGLHCLLGTLKSGNSIEINGKSTSLEEAQTVGLGPHAGDPLTENKLRADMPGLKQRLTYP